MPLIEKEAELHDICRNKQRRQEVLCPLLIIRLARVDPYPSAHLTIDPRTYAATHLVSKPQGQGGNKQAWTTRSHNQM